MFTPRRKRFPQDGAAGLLARNLAALLGAAETPAAGPEALAEALLAATDAVKAALEEMAFACRRGHGFPERACSAVHLIRTSSETSLEYGGKVFC